MCLLEWMPNLQLDNYLPSRSVPKDKVYSNVVYEPTSGLVVGAAALRSNFSTFDEENNEVWVPDGKTPLIRHNVTLIWYLM